MISVIGLGNMGEALARAFLRKGYRVTVWNRTAAKADRLAAEGARRAESVAEAAEAGRFVVVCVTTYEIAHRLLEPAQAP